MNRRQFLSAAAGAALVPAAPVAVAPAPEAADLLFVSPPCQLLSRLSMIEQYEEAELVRQLVAGLGHSLEQLRIAAGATVYRQFDAPVRT